MRGRLAFCDAFIFGRVGKVALQEITRHAYAVPFASEMNARLVESLKLLKSRVLNGSPRSLSCKLLDTFFLFTDASFNRDTGAGLGAVLISGTGQVLSWFGLQRDTEVSFLFLDGEP